MNPRQPAIRKVLIPVDEKMNSPALSEIFYERKQKNEKNAFYIRVGNRRTS